MIENRSTAYLNYLQTGFNLVEYDYLSDGSGITQVVVPFSASRVFIQMEVPPTAFNNFFIQLPSGLLVSITQGANADFYISTLALHYSSPSLPIVCTNAFPGMKMRGWGLQKL
jgi:hypothetical protein